MNCRMNYFLLKNHDKSTFTCRSQIQASEGEEVGGIYRIVKGEEGEGYRLVRRGLGGLQTSKGKEVKG